MTGLYLDMWSSPLIHTHSLTHIYRHLVLGILPLTDTVRKFLCESAGSDTNS